MPDLNYPLNAPDSYIRVQTNYYKKCLQLNIHNEENFIVIDPTETRYWIRKIPVLISENIHLLQDMEKEINYFLYYLLQRPLSVPQGLTRMWFSEKQLRTDALLLELLKKSVHSLSRQNISVVLQQEWGMEPVSNSLSYQTYIYNAANELVPVHYTGRYYTITQNWFEQKFDESS